MHTVLIVALAVVAMSLLVFLAYSRPDPQHTFVFRLLQTLSRRHYAEGRRKHAPRMETPHR